MTQLTIINNKTMSSREIAEVTGKEISHIHRDIRTMLDDLKDDPELDHVSDDKDARGYTTCFHLPKGLTMTLVAGYSTKLRKAIIDRWQELEAQAANPVLALSRIDLLKLALDSEEQRLKLEGQVQVLAPKAEALDRITLSDGSMCLTNAAKVLGVQPKKFFAWMQEHQWIYRRAGGAGFTGYQARIQVGYLDHKVTTVSRSNGSDKTVEQVLVTPKGLAKLANLMQPICTI